MTRRFGPGCISAGSAGSRAQSHAVFVISKKRIDSGHDQGYSRGYREAAMKYRGFVAAGVMFCGLSAGQLLAQAAAESVLTHGLSSAAGSNVGKTLGNAMGNAASQLGGRLGQQTSTVPSVQRVSAVKVKTAGVPVSATTPATTSAPGSLIASIQGGAAATPTCAASKTAQADSSATKAAGAAPVPATPAGVATTPVAPASTCPAMKDSDSHPAVVNLPAAN